MRTLGQLSTIASLSQLTEIAEFIAEMAGKAGLDEDSAFAVGLAVDEACNNIIAHAYTQQNPGPIWLTCQMKERDFVVSIQDQGRPFAPDQVPTPVTSGALDKREVGGLGIHFMRKLMDVVRFEFDRQSGNTLTMIKTGVVPSTGQGT